MPKSIKPVIGGFVDCAKRNMIIKNAKILVYGRGI